MTEREFLDGEMWRAQAALAQTVQSARQHALDLADVGYWGRNYPWQTVGASAALGFLFGAAVAPKRPAAAEKPRVESAVRRAKQAGWARPALTAFLEIGRFVFQNVLLTGWQAAQAPPEMAPEPELSGSYN